MLYAVISVEFVCVLVYFKRWRWSFFYLWLCSHLIRRVSMAIDRDITAVMFEVPMLVFSALAASELSYCLLAKGRGLNLGLCAAFAAAAAALALDGFRLHSNVWGIMYARPYVFAFLAVALLIPVIYSGLYEEGARYHWTATLMIAWLLTSVVVRLWPYRDLAEWNALNRAYLTTDCLLFSGWILVEMLPSYRAVPSRVPALRPRTPHGF